MTLKSSLMVAATLALMVPLASHAAMPQVPPDQMVMPCERHVQVKDITRLVIPMTPFRGVNLVFPFELGEGTNYALSSDLVWNYNKANGTRIVSIYFDKFQQNQWGELADLTISKGPYMFSITLKADPDIRNHCSNVVFDFSPTQMEAIKKGEKKDYLAQLDKEYQEKLKKLDERAANQALALVGSLAQGDPDETNVHEYNTLELSNGDEVELYVTEIQGWGKFSVAKAEISNNSEVSPLYIQDVEVGRLDGDRHIKISGYPDYEGKAAGGEGWKIGRDNVGRMTFTTTENIPETNAYMRLKTDRGEVEVKW